jgi:hypothetical protein
MSVAACNLSFFLIIRVYTPCLEFKKTSLFFVYLESSPNSEVDLLMDKLGGETGPDNEVVTSKQQKKRRRRQILNNTFDFLAIVMSILKRINFFQKNYLLFF